MSTLTDYKAIQSNIFVRLDVQYYKANSGSSPTPTILTFSDRVDAVTIDGDVYIGLGNLVAITDSSTELRASAGSLTITLSGIPNSSIYEIVNSRIKGCPIRIYRGFFDTNTGAVLPVPNNPAFKYIGQVNNYTLQEEYDFTTRTSSNTLVLVCANTSEILSKKIAGRKTNESAMKRYYPNDTSMDRITALTGVYFDFGKKK